MARLHHTKEAYPPRSLKQIYKGFKAAPAAIGRNYVETTIENSASWAMPARRLVPPEPFAIILLSILITARFPESPPACTAPLPARSRSPSSRISSRNGRSAERREYFLVSYTIVITNAGGGDGATADAALDH